jgi:hypothetical protein
MPPAEEVKKNLQPEAQPWHVRHIAARFGQLMALQKITRRLRSVHFGKHGWLANAPCFTSIFI